MCTRLLLLLIALVAVPTTRATEFCPPRDIVFILQSSGAVGEDGWQQIQEFTTSLIENELDADGTRVGVVVFSSDVFSFPLTDDFAAASAYIESFPWLGESTHLVDAFLAAIPMFDGGPPANEKCIFLVAVGNHVNGQDVCEDSTIVDALVANGITVGMVGAIEGWDSDALTCLVEDPDTDQQEMDGFMGLDTVFCGQGLVEAFLEIDVVPFGLDAPWSFVGGPHGESRSGVGADEPESVVLGNYLFTWGDVPGYETPAPNPVEIMLESGFNQIVGTYDEASAVEEVVDEMAFAFAHSENPFVGPTEIRFTLPEPELVHLAIYDVSGRVLRRLVAGVWTPSGHQAVAWDGRDDQGRLLSSGSYIASLSAGTRHASKRMILLR